MIDLAIKTNTSELLRDLQAWQKQEIPFAAAGAATDVAFKVRTGIQDEMRAVFKSPTAWTLGGMVVDQADKSGRPARVRFEESSAKGTPAGRYLRPQIEGGGRGHTPFENRLIRAGRLKPGEYLVPGKYADRDGSGNVNPGQVTKILSDLGTVETALRSANARDRGVRRAETYELLRPASGAPAGIYRQQGAKKLLVFLIVRQPQYEAILDLKGVAARIVQREYAPAFRRRFAAAQASSRNNPANLQKVAA